jgi:hypothetical protein
MKKFKNITFVHDNSGDWMGIYIDGVLVRENHSYDADDMLDVLEIEYNTHWIDMPDSRLPAKLEDLNLTGDHDGTGQS